MATRERVLDTAASLFADSGIEQISTNRIASEAGISIGTLYRYFQDKSEIVSELVERLIHKIEDRFTQSVPQIPANAVRSEEAYFELVQSILSVFLDELVESSALVKALIGEVQFYSSGLPELDQRLRLMVKVITIQIVGPGDETRLNAITSVLINTGFAAVVRASSVGVPGDERDTVIAMTSRMMSAWLYGEHVRPRV
ncbi:TetR/AcrR family transcriptional regulator [Nocardia asteroides]|uniref:TetR/AcrR family transcriptional regulator n=1 Tax=Nocardia asteroides TaxID=1824 RepID=UPI00341BF7A4